MNEDAKVKNMVKQKRGFKWSGYVLDQMIFFFDEKRNFLN